MVIRLPLIIFYTFEKPPCRDMFEQEYAGSVSRNCSGNFYLEQGNAALGDDGINEYQWDLNLQQPYRVY